MNKARDLFLKLIAALIILVTIGDSAVMAEQRIVTGTLAPRSPLAGGDVSLQDPASTVLSYLVRLKKVANQKAKRLAMVREMMQMIGRTDGPSRQAMVRALFDAMKDQEFQSIRRAMVCVAGYAFLMHREMQASSAQFDCVIDYLHEKSKDDWDLASQTDVEDEYACRFVLLAFRNNAQFQLRYDQLSRLLLVIMRMNSGDLRELILKAGIKEALKQTDSLHLNADQFREILDSVKDATHRYTPTSLWIQTLGVALASQPEFIDTYLEALESAQWDDLRDLLLQALVMASSHRPGMSRAVAKALNKGIGLKRIEFMDGGNSVNTASYFAEQLLVAADNVVLKKFPEGMPRYGEFRWRDHKGKLDSLEGMLQGHMLIKALGRTLIYRTPEGKFLALKFLKENERMEALYHESRMFDYLNRHGKEMGLHGKYPKSCMIEKDKRVWGVKQLPKDALKALSLQRDKNGKRLRLRRISDKPYHFMAYIADTEDYFVYLNDVSLPLRDFERASMTCLHDLFALARHGILSMELIELFHNVILEDREDNGRYLWMTDILQSIQSINGRTGAGRLNAWTNAVSYPNMRVSGNADFAATHLLEEIVDPYNPLMSRRLLNSFKRDKPDHDHAVFILASFLGEYLLSWALLAGSYFREKDGLEWKKPELLARVMCKGFTAAFRGFTGLSEERAERMAETVNWRRLARQMAFFMAKHDVYAGAMLRNVIPHPLYELPKQSIKFSDDFKKSRGWLNTKSRQGWYFDKKHPDLGPVNGPFPLQELIKALYLYSGFMITATLEKTKYNNIENAGLALDPIAFAL